MDIKYVDILTGENCRPFSCFNGPHLFEGGKGVRVNGMGWVCRYFRHLQASHYQST